MHLRPETAERWRLRNFIRRVLRSESLIHAEALLRIFFADSANAMSACSITSLQSGHPALNISIFGFVAIVGTPCSLKTSYRATLPWREFTEYCPLLLLSDQRHKLIFYRMAFALLR